MLSCQRDQFSLPDEGHYLNCAYMSPLSRRVELAGMTALRRKRDPSTIEPRDFFEGLETVRGRFATLIGVADSARVAVMPSVSYGISTVARNTPLSPGQNIVLLEEQFPSNVFVWRRIAAQAGAEVRTVGPPAGAKRRGREWMARLLEAVDRNTQVVALGQAHWTDGTLFDVEQVGVRAREVGAALVIDGSQSIGALPFDVGVVKPDALISAGYKWLMGPYGLSVAYYGPRYDDGVPLEETWLSRSGSEDFRRLVDYRDEYRPLAARYDMGEASNFTLVPMLATALEQLLEWTVPAIAEWCGRLTRDLARQAEDLGFRVEEEVCRAPHILGLGLPEHLDPDSVQRALAERGVSVSARGSMIRVSPHVYNDDADVAAAVEALAAVSRRPARA